MDKKEIEQLCKNLIGKSLKDVEDEILKNSNILNIRKSNKGLVGQLVESYFGLKNNSNPAPDFEKLGLELKVTGIKVSKKRSSDSIIYYVPKERVKLSKINYFEILKEINFKDSHIYKKCKNILFIFYLYQKNQNVLNYKFINYVFYNLDKDVNYPIIEKDYRVIQKKIESGLAHELSESDTELLGACTNSVNSKIMVNQPNSQLPAKPRAFSFKVKQVFNILNNINTPNLNHLENDLKNKIDAYRYKSIEELCELFDINVMCKNIKSIIMYKILETNNYSEYINKFNINKIMFKNITIKESGSIKEEIGLIDVNFDEFTKINDFYDSEFFLFLDKLKIYFIVWKKVGETEILDSLKTYEIDSQKIKSAKIVWEHTRNLFLNSNCIKEIVNGKKKYNFIKKNDNLFFHIRPHDTKSVNRFKMKNGQYLCKFQYWLNNDVIK